MNYIWPILLISLAYLPHSFAAHEKCFNFNGVDPKDGQVCFKIEDNPGNDKVTYRFPSGEEKILDKLTLNYVPLPEGSGQPKNCHPVNMTYFKQSKDINLIFQANGKLTQIMRNGDVRVLSDVLPDTYSREVVDLGGYQLHEFVVNVDDHNQWYESYLMKGTDGPVIKFTESSQKSSLVMNSGVLAVTRADLTLPVEQLTLKSDFIPEHKVNLHSTGGFTHYVDLGAGRWVPLPMPKNKIKNFHGEVIEYKNEKYTVLTVSTRATAESMRAFVIRHSDGKIIRTYRKDFQELLFVSRELKLSDDGKLALGKKHELIDLDSFDKIAASKGNIPDDVLKEIAVSDRATAVSHAKDFEATKFKATPSRAITNTLPPNCNGCLPFLDLIRTSGRDLTMDVIVKIAKDKVPSTIGRLAPTEEIMDGLVREKSFNVFLLGEPGSGKTNLVEEVALRFYSGLVPEAKIYKNLVSKNPIFVEIKAELIADNISEFLNALKITESVNRRPIILFIDDVHDLKPDAFEALKPFMKNENGIRFILSSTHNEFNSKFRGKTDSILQNFRVVNVEPFTNAEAIGIIRDDFAPGLALRVNGEIGDDVIEMAVKHSKEYMPGVGKIAASQKLLEDAAIMAHRKAGKNTFKLEEKDLGVFLAKNMKLPFNPYDRAEFNQKLQKIKRELNEDVVDQEKAVDVVVETLSDVMNGVNLKKSHRVILLAGSTGTGKSYLGKRTAIRTFDSEDRFYEIDASKIQEQGEIVAQFGLDDVYKNAKPGEFINFITGRGKGVNIIVINELEKAMPEFRNAIMEMLDTGIIQGGDGKRYPIGKSLVILTTNKGAKKIFPTGGDKIFTKEELRKKLGHFSEDEIKKFLSESDSSSKDKAPAEFAARIDRAAAMGPISMEGAIKEAKKQMVSINQGYKKFGYQIQLDDEVVEKIVQEYYVQESGLRSMQSGLGSMLAKIEAQIKEAHQGIPKNSEPIKVILEKSFVGAAKAPVLHIEVPHTQAPLTVTMQVSSAKFINPIATKEGREKLDSLGEKVKMRVIGQDDMVDRAVEAILTRSSNPNVLTPVRLFVPGPTGTGKTELFKSLAETEFGTGYDLIMNMGAVTSAEHFDEIFGTQRSKGKLQLWLDQHKEGGYIVFDEMGNMPQAFKEKTMQILYKILDEGIYDAPDGQSYKLKKFRIGMTSNEMQELFKDSPNDDLRMSQWKRYKNEEVLKRYMIENHGWTEPQFARIDAVLLAKPLLHSERVMIAKKLISPIVDGAAKVNGIKEVIYDEKFFDLVADTFFTHSGGARDMRKVAESSLNSMIIKLVKELGDNAHGATVHVKMTDNYLKRLKFFGRRAPVREVILEMSSGDLKFTADLVDRAAEKRLVKSESLRVTAFHEAGHAITNNPDLTEQYIDFITVKGQGGYGGYARYETISGASGTWSRERVVAMIARSMGGAEAEKLLGIPANSGWSSDLQSATSLAETAIVKWGLSDKALQFKRADGKVLAADPLVHQEITKLLEEGRAQANKTLVESWPMVEALANILQVKGQINREYLDHFTSPKNFEKFLARKKDKLSVPPTLDPDAPETKNLKIANEERIKCLQRNLLNLSN